MTEKVSESRENWVQDFAIGLQDVFELNPAEAQERARLLMDRICEVRPADRYYWPAKDKAKRDEAIAREFNGRNMEVIKRKFGVSAGHVYSIRSKVLQKRFNGGMK
jgi:Mor family transcriptional regulator